MLAWTQQTKQTLKSRQPNYDRLGSSEGNFMVGVNVGGRFATMAGRSHLPSTANSTLYSFLLFVITLSLQQVYKEKLASSELYTIFGGFVASLLFLLVLTFIGNIQESIGTRTGWGAVILAEVVAGAAAGSVHRVCVTTCIIFSVGFLYELNKLSGIVHQQPESTKKKAH